MYTIICTIYIQQLHVEPCGLKPYVEAQKPRKEFHVALYRCILLQRGSVH